MDNVAVQSEPNQTLSTATEFVTPSKSNFFRKSFNLFRNRMNKMASKFPSKVLPEDVHMTRTPLGTFSLSTKVINRNVAAVDASDAIEIQADVAVNVSKTTQKEFDVLPTFLS